MRTLAYAMAAIVVCLSVTPVCLATEGTDHICFRRIDANSDGKVTFEEFAEFFGQDRPRFDTVDQDRDGVLTHDEYHDHLGHGSS